MNPRLQLIMARDLGGAIGLNGALPWQQRGDLRHFARLTRGHVILMGRATLDSLPAPRGLPLPGRVLVTVSRRPVPWGHQALNPQAGLALARELSLRHCEGRPVWLIGGAQLTQALASEIDEAELTLIQTQAAGDAWLPQLGLQLVSAGPWQQHPGDDHPWRQEHWSRPALGTNLSPHPPRTGGGAAS